VQLRQRGQFGFLSADVLDFNRHGLAALVERPLPKDKVVFLNLHCAGLRLREVVGVVHNCVAQGNGFRCGIRFRTQSHLQFDREDVEYALREIEGRMAGPDPLASDG
jgi:hypothetical protein